MDRIAVIGGGPAGLRVAQVLARAGREVHLYEQKRSVGRKFLIAGKSGLNLTNATERADFLSRYKGVEFPHEQWAEIYDAFTSDDLRAWAAALGQVTFVSSGQKVFPQDMKAAPLLRSLVREIKAEGGVIHVNHGLRGIEKKEEGYELCFQTPDGKRVEEFHTVVLALGGGSWAQTGSDGKWVSLLKELGVNVHPLLGANTGWEVAWSPSFLKAHEGTPVKNVICKVGEDEVKGEFVITSYGVEGGPVYRLGHALRAAEMPVMTIDLKPDFSVDELLKKAESVRKNAMQELARRWKVSETVMALLADQAPTTLSKEKVSVEDLRALAELVKAFPLKFTKQRPIEEAISSAGGVVWSEMNEDLSLLACPGVYLCGEMLDWEAPTGGFLLQGCFSSATWVADGILRREGFQPSSH